MIRILTAAVVQVQTCKVGIFVAMGVVFRRGFNSKRYDNSLNGFLRLL